LRRGGWTHCFLFTEKKEEKVEIDAVHRGKRKKKKPRL